MNYHIVRTNDKMETIINLYNLTTNELVDLNKHITNWNNLIPGTRIKLPPISEALFDELNDIEPFIEDYYPKIDIKRYESKDEKETDESTKEKKIDVSIDNNDSIYNKEEEKEEVTKNGNFTNTIKLPYTYYYNPYDYYRYQRRRIK